MPNESPTTSECSGPKAGGISSITVFGAAKPKWRFCISAPPDAQECVAIFLPRASKHRRDPQELDETAA